MSRPSPLTEQAEPPIPMADLAAQNSALREEIAAALMQAIDSGKFILGPNVQAFEREAARFLGTAEAVAVASGTDALHLALRAAGVGAGDGGGDEVITTPFSFIATANAIRYAGARPVFVDIDPRTYCIGPEAIAAAITPRTRAVLPVHLYGQPAAIDDIAALCARHGIALIEDCAQSFGARRAGRMTGSFGLAGCFSFYPSKNLSGMGDAGLVTTSSPELAARLRRLRNHGGDRYGVYEETGFNSRMDELQAAVLRIKLRHLGEYNAARRTVAREYARALAGAAVTLPWEDERGEHVYHQYTVLCADRERVHAALAAAGIASAVHYALPLHLQRVYAEYAAQSLPVAEDVARRCLSLPMFPGITAGQIERVTRVVRASA